MERTRGFSLIELLVVVAIVAILAAMATASYGRYAYRSRRVDGQQMLTAVAHAEERWYATYHRYTDDLARMGFVDVPALSSRGYYAVTVEVADEAAQSYIATAEPLGSQAGDACGMLTTNNAGGRMPGPDDADANANGRCW